jgi:glycosidase
MMIKYLLILLCLIFTNPCSAQIVQYPHLEWTRNANIYEVNIRQYTPEGTIRAFERHLPRLQKMGVKILWIMPIQPIGIKERKGQMGSYYSIRDYKAVNPEFGTQADFNRLVNRAHRLGMKVLLDWVANHTAWDNIWVSQHPEWYLKNTKGNISSYEYNNGRETEYWTDVIGLDYRQTALHDAMIDAMRFWVLESDIDGFRCDVASLVPTAFWIRARAELERVKPLFMLAESDNAELHAAFDMTYDWKLLDAFVDISQGKSNASILRKWLETGQQSFPPDAYRMTFTSNHDVNSWRWSDREMYGEKFPVFAVLAATLPGMPLIYGGQESDLEKKIAFFEKDTIDWKKYKNTGLYQKLLRLKAIHPALRNGKDGGSVKVLSVESDDIFAFSRVSQSRKITVIANLSGKNKIRIIIPEVGLVNLGPWDYRILDNQ